MCIVPKHRYINKTQTCRMWHYNTHKCICVGAIQVPNSTCRWRLIVTEFPHSALLYSKGIWTHFHSILSTHIQELKLNQVKEIPCVPCLIESKQMVVGFHKGNSASGAEMFRRKSSRGGTHKEKCEQISVLLDQTQPGPHPGGSPLIDTKTVRTSPGRVTREW